MKSKEEIGEPNVEAQMLNAWRDFTGDVQDEIAATSSEDEALEVAERASTNLHGLYPYLHKEVTVKGPGVTQDVDDDGEPTGEPYLKTDIFCTGVHEGFEVIGVTDMNAPDVPVPEEDLEIRIFHRILTDLTVTNPHATVQRKVYVFSFLDWEQSTVVPSTEIDQIYEQPKIDVARDERVAIINTLSKQFAQELNSTTFRRMNHAAQKRRVQQLLMVAEEKTQLRESPIMVESEYVYVPALTETGLEFQYLFTAKTVLEGTCVAIESLETPGLRTKAIRRDADLLEKNAGLCIVIDPTRAVREYYGLGEDQVLYLPTYNNEHEAVIEGINVANYQ